MSGGSRPAAAAESLHDLVVVGSGAAGMACAIVAHELGLQPVVLEKAPWFGGSTALSGGATWIPNNPHQVAAGRAESRAAVLAYLRGETGNRGSEAHWEAFLDKGPEMVAFLEARSELKFSVRPVAPDYHSDREGAGLGWRVLDPLDYDGRRLGADFDRLRPPVPEFTILGGMMVGRQDLPHLFAMTRSLRSARHVAGILARHLADRLGHRRGTRLVMGNAMAARLGHSLLARGIPLELETAAVELLVEQGRVAGVVAERQGRRRLFRARRGVVLAGGGIPHAPGLAGQIAPHRDLRGHWSMSPAHNSGDSVGLAAPLGGHLLESNSDNGFWTPVSLLPQPGGGVRPFPHLFLDRAKPGVVAVDRSGRRFVNEAASYHDFVRGLLGRDGGRGSEPPVWLVADHRAIRRYGLGAVRPFLAALGRHLRSGYLKRADTPEALAAALGIDAGGLRETLAAFNRDAAAGEDRAFGKGSTAYNRYLGDPENRPNPCLRPLDRPPFYAIQLHPGDIGASMGLETDPQARVLDGEGRPIPGLYACGNDANSIMAGAYPGAGITLGPALTFGYIAARQLAGDGG
ncbi:FAD-binding protein [Tistlia consotensis]|uniref:FAD-binding protein n=1 Tax=Tistlia consotensis TaxID=1321365 RepID=UPI00190E6783|nr:FAD-binding protein [Tistlia consotensis]